MNEANKKISDLSTSKDLKGPHPNSQTQEITQNVVEKPKKPEEKPFNEFINEDLIPSLTQALETRGFPPKSLFLQKGERPVSGGNCWIVFGEISFNRRFWICFSEEKLSSIKTISLAEPGTEPSTIESFLIDEKKITLGLLQSRILQRLNGQKWIGKN